jgi:predicted AAA+ superfamily ATPase
LAPAWRRRAKVKEVASPKFHFFDPGVVRALAGRQREPVEAAERGTLLETLVLHELRAAMSYQKIDGHLSYWRTPWGREVDFVWSRGSRAVGIEVKASRTWRSDHGTALKALVEGGQLTAGHGVYTGDAERKDGPIHVWPVAGFFARLTRGDILGE